MHMKYTITTLAAFALGMALFVQPAAAATTATLSPASIDATAGRQFTVTIAVDPHGASDYAEKIEIDYPAGLLRMDSFMLGSGWMALSQPGYDSEDAVNGILVKTAGYPKGIAAPTAFGTIHFTALKAGSGTVSIGGQSMALEASSQSALTGSGVAVTVSAPAAVPANKPIVSTAPAKQAQQASSTAASSTAQKIGPSLNEQAAAANSAGTWNYALILAIIVAIASAAAWLYNRKQGSHE